MEDKITNGEASVSEKQHQRMLNTPMPKLILSLAIPSIIGQMVTVIYNTADTWFVSQISTEASAAVGIVFALMTIIQALGFGIGMGSGSLISMKLGEKENDEAHKFASSGFFAAALIGLFITVFGLIFLEPLMRVLGSTDDILPYSSDYAIFILIGAPFMCSSFILSTVLRSEGESTLSTIGLCSGGLLNVILDPIFITGLGMGISGAGLATAIGQLVSFCVLFLMFLRDKSIVKLKFSYISRHFSDYRLIITTGVPTIFRQGMASIASAVLNIQAAAYGAAAVAAITIANRIYMLVRTVVLGIGMGFQPIAGYNFGAKNYKRTKQSFWYATLYGTAFCLICTVLLFIFNNQIIMWFRNDPAVIEKGSKTLIFGCMVMPFMAYSTFVNQLYQCLGFRIPATVLACCRQGIFFLPIVIIAPFFIGLTGVQIAQAGADFLTFIASVPFQIVFCNRVLKDR